MRSLVGIGFNADGIVCVYGLIVNGIRGGTVTGGVNNVFVVKDRGIVRVIVKRVHTVFSNACIQTSIIVNMSVTASIRVTRR